MSKRFTSGLAAVQEIHLGAGQGSLAMALHESRWQRVPPRPPRSCEAARCRICGREATWIFVPEDARFCDFHAFRVESIAIEDFYAHASPPRG